MGRPRKRKGDRTRDHPTAPINTSQQDEVEIQAIFTDYDDVLSIPAASESEHKHHVGHLDLDPLEPNPLHQAASLENAFLLQSATEHPSQLVFDPNLTGFPAHLPNDSGLLPTYPPSDCGDTLKAFFMDPEPSLPIPLSELSEVQRSMNPQPPPFPPEAILGIYEKLSSVLFTLHRENEVLSQATMPLNHLEHLFQSVSTLCDVIQAIVTHAHDSPYTVEYSSEKTASGIFKLGLTGVSLVLGVYKSLLHCANEPLGRSASVSTSLRNRRNTTESLSTEKLFHGSFPPGPWPGAVGNTDTMLRYTIMNIHLRRLRYLFEASTTELRLDPRLSVQFDETKNTLDVLLVSLQGFIVQM
ncbi:hypothetical protein BBP40_005858 [Aspergillus hancockii]|nr:hypothetical protein BBP40_005858 [Aspergillus hancockii]